MRLEVFSYKELKDIAIEMDLSVKRCKEDMIKEINSAFRIYEKYAKDKIYKYKKVKQLGESGKEGVTYLVTNKKGGEFAMKTFRKGKSSKNLVREASLQKRAADLDVSPNVIDVDTVSKYIVMDKMDEHLLDVIKRQRNSLNKRQQKEIIQIFKKLDKSGIFHGDANILNYMCKDNKVYVIDFGMSKEITTAMIKKCNTSNPNLDLMTIVFILKLKELKCNPSSYDYLLKFVNEEQRQKFKL